VTCWCVTPPSCHNSAHDERAGLPPGFPTPPTPRPTYTVYLTPKQWRPVADALQDPADTCSVEGFPASDPALEGVAVYALQVSTKQRHPAHRAEHPPRSSRGPAIPAVPHPAAPGTGCRMRQATHPSSREKRRRRPEDGIREGKLENAPASDERGSEQSYVSETVLSETVPQQAQEERT
jgi:hypothetical protein